jgi:hypothetical protein
MEPSGSAFCSDIPVERTGKLFDLRDDYQRAGILLQLLLHSVECVALSWRMQLQSWKFPRRPASVG